MTKSVFMAATNPEKLGVEFVGLRLDVIAQHRDDAETKRLAERLVRITDWNSAT